MPMRSPLVEALESLAPAGITLGSLEIGEVHTANLHPDEAALVRGAGEVRRREFATGRALLHRLLPASGPILRAESGAPLFPPRTVGSLAHDRRHALAAVADGRQFAALGIDLEPHQLDPDHVVRDAVLRSDDSLVDPIAAFVMKEAAYKAWGTLGGWMVGPLEVRLTVIGSAFTASMPHQRHETSQRHDTFDGVVVSAAGYWVAFVATPRR